MWYAIATEIEAQRDQASHDAGAPGTRELASLLGDRPIFANNAWDRAARLVEDAPALLETAAMTDLAANQNIDDSKVWRAALDRTLKNIDAPRAALEPEPPSMSRGLGW